MTKSTMAQGIQRYIKRLESCQSLYATLLDAVPKGYKQATYKITDRELFEKAISTFVTALEPQNAKGDLMDIYDIAIHIKTKALIIANKGATLFTLTSRHETPSIVRHIGLCVYMPGVGMEYANAGIVGNVYDKKIVLRSESACTPSFIFGSQRCNCHHQWENVRELAASFNPVEVPDISLGAEFEKWVQSQFAYKNGKHICQNTGELGFVMLHVDSQNGMGSGYTKGEFVFDLAERASLRHRGEYTSEQIYSTSMYGGFTSIGIIGDPRSESDGVGYQITPVILDYLGVNKDVIMLTNNRQKIQKMERAGYTVERVKSIGAVNVAGAVEAHERGKEFNHMDINSELTTFMQDYGRMRAEITKLAGKG
ncbi:MAG TPA: hypothetical protein VLH86_02760 [Patescibacteria group bacterium]|nr:hypothetical protein [Patescibacteria group bacterium]